MNVHEIALGALLHDIGKFMQRAHPPGQGLGAQSRGMADFICPSVNGRHSHQHVLYTNEFVETMPFTPPGLDKSAVANLASYHHRPDTEAQRFITEADRLSSGMEREEMQEDETDPRVRFRRVRLLSVAAVTGRPEADPAGAGSFRLRPLSPDTAFPVSFSAETDLTGEYRSLWDAFAAEWAQNRCPAPFGFTARALSALERHTWCIPSATNALPDISLFDHLKTTAAIAVCLADEAADRDAPFLLTAGDLAGIQRYLFDIKPGTGGLARRLRARSFHVAAFSQAVWLGILRRLDLPPTQVILSAGGKFHLMLPNTPGVRTVLEESERAASEWLMTETSGEAALALASIPCTRADLSSFSATLSRLHHALRLERDRAGRTRLLRKGVWREESFVLPALDVRDGLCRCCGRRGGTLSTTPDGDEELKCETCRDEEKTGRLLPKARYAAFYSDNSGAFEAPLGSYSVLPEDRNIRGRPDLILDMDGAPDGTEKPEWPLSAQAWARHAPRHDDGTLLEFQEIADKAAGRAALACLKMDVDDLGWMFAHGLKSPQRDSTSISRVATLSRTLDLFFRAAIPRIMQEEYPPAYLVYAGGDDLLAIGPWDQMFGLAALIRRDFSGFTGNNPAWTLSAGVSLMGSHTPVLTAAEEADRRLEGSKSVPGGGAVPWPLPGQAPGDVPAKDRITAFGTSIPWALFEGVLGNAVNLQGWIEQGVINTGKARRLLRCAEMHREYQRTRDARHFQYAPALVYDLKRNWKEDTPAQRDAKEWAAALATPASEDIGALRFVCEYALYAVRGRTKET